MYNLLYYIGNYLLPYSMGIPLDIGGPHPILTLPTTYLYIRSIKEQSCGQVLIE